jgi:hypothetical protein
MLQFLLKIDAIIFLFLEIKRDSRETRGEIEIISPRFLA